jgi:ELWxxDGT repeat protein
MNTEKESSLITEVRMRAHPTIERLESRTILDGTGASSVAIGDTLFFVQDRALWKSDLDGGNAVEVSGGEGGHFDPQWLVNCDGTLIFTAYQSGGYNRELFRSDGTAQGTYMIKDLHLYGASSSPHDFFWLNGHLLFQASNGSWAQTLWVTDGTVDGTQTISPPSIYTYSNDQQNMDLREQILYWDQYDYNYLNVRDTVRWQTDGTVAGTKLASGGVIQSGVLRIFGMPGDDTIQISSSGGVTTLISSSDGTQNFDNDDFNGIEIHGLTGKDTIQLDDSVLDNATISASDNDDVVRGGGGNDYISAGGTVNGGAGNDTINGNGLLEGGAGDDVIAGIGTLYGNDGNDTLRDSIISNGGSLLDGGVGDDNLFGAYAGSSTLLGGVGNDTLTGGDWSATDNMVGGDGNDSLYGGAGDDTLDGGAGADTLEGGPGNDSIISNTDDTLIEYKQYTIDHGVAHFYGTDHNDQINLQLGDHGEIVFSIDGAITNVSDPLTGVQIDALGGNDRIYVGGGITPFILPVTLNGGTGNDFLTGGDGNDFIDGGDGADTLEGGAGDDTLVGDTNDSIDGGAGNNTTLSPQTTPVPAAVVSSSLAKGVLQVSGTSSDDTILIRRRANKPSMIQVLVNGISSSYRFTGITQIRISAGDGNDAVGFDPSLGKWRFTTRIGGGAGNDSLSGSANADRICGGDGNDWINAGTGNDSLYGDAGNDRLFGGDGKDYVSGGGGANVLRAGAGRDKIRATKLIDDFRGNKEDVITLL